MSETSKFYCPFSNLLQITSSGLSIGMLMKKQTTSCELNISSSSILIPAMYVLKSFELLTWCSVVPNKGPSMSASHRYVVDNRTCVVDYRSLGGVLFVHIQYILGTFSAVGYRWSYWAVVIFPLFFSLFNMSTSFLLYSRIGSLLSFS